jgi:hypothetical protein
MKYSRKYSTYGLVIASMFVMACDQTGQLPNGAEVRISPSGHSIDITQVTNTQGSCLFDPTLYIDTPLLLSVHDDQGSPIGEAEVSVNIEFAGNSFLGPPVLSLYDDLNSNGVVDAETEYVSGREDDAYTGKTAKFSGEKLMLLRINLSCPYKGNIYVRSQFASNSINVEVNATDVVTIDLPDTEG